MDILGNGLLFGLALAFFVGPVFFALIQTSIHKGFKFGAAMAIGISLSDLMYIIICYIGISHVLESESLKAALSIAGGGIMFTFGLSSFRKPVLVKSHDTNMAGNNHRLWHYGIKGIMLNGVNPFVLLYWVAVVSYSTVEYSYTGHQVIWFFGTIITTVLITDLIKPYMAHRLGGFITEKNMTILNRVVGVAFVAFAVRLFYSGFAVIFVQF
jgi:threonine/homoserine/homoserine lactone efflux protein